MNKRGMVAKALNILAAAGIIALVFISFTIASSVFITKQAFDIGASTDDVSRAGQLRVFARAIADDLVQGDCSRVQQLARDAYGAEAKVAVSVDGRIVCGEALSSRTIEIILPRPGGGIMRVGVQRS